MTPDPGSSGADSSVRIAAVIEAEAAVFEELAALMPLQRRALLDADRDEVERCVACAETLATRFRLLEQERARLESEAGDARVEETDGPIVDARGRLLAALEHLMKDGAINSTLLARLGDSVMARQAAIASLFGATYLADGRTAEMPSTGLSLSKEG